MKHVMLDLETMSTGPNAAIVAIGAVAFDPVTKQMGEEFYASVDLKSAMDAGGVVDASTVYWWLAQSRKAQEALYIGKRELRAVLTDFADYCISLDKDLCVWGNGATFDNVILSSAYRATGLERPWSYRGDRCFRTIKALFPGFVYAPSEVGGVAHNALDDARQQVEQLFQLPIEVK